MTDTEKAAPAADDAVRRVLAANVEGFERGDAMAMAVVGFVLAALNLAMVLLMLWRAPEGDGMTWARPIFHTVTTLVLAALVTQHIRAAGLMLLAVVSTMFVVNILNSLLGEAVNYIGLVMTSVVALFVLGKMVPGLGALKTLDKGERSPALKLMQSICMAAGGLAILSMLAAPFGW